jgi:hypothetical protein
MRCAQRDAREGQESGCGSPSRLGAKASDRLQLRSVRIKVQMGGKEKLVNVDPGNLITSEETGL